jgi:hypothetical protein
MRRTTLASLLVFLAVGVALVALAGAQAPPTWKQGQPANLADSTLAPIPQPPAPKAPGGFPRDNKNHPRRASRPPSGRAESTMRG